MANNMVGNNDIVVWPAAKYCKYKALGEKRHVYQRATTRLTDTLFSFGVASAPLRRKARLPCNRDKSIL